jgi:hypothetical protein
MAIFPAAAHATTAISTIDVDFDFHEVRYRDSANRRIYPAVLPKPNALQSMQLERQPVWGLLSQIDHKPTWWPTPNTRRARPTLPQAVPYGHRLHPIGIYRLRVHWQNPTRPNFWQYVRIHGGAKEQDLYQKLSSGCVRMLDANISEMVSLIRHAGGTTLVTFGYGLTLNS